MVQMQKMISRCYDIACELSLKFNVNKSHCIAFGRFYKHHLTSLLLGSKPIAWCSTLNYLGVQMISGRYLRFDIMHSKHTFYSACNNIFSHSVGLDELMVLSLQET